MPMQLVDVLSVSLIRYVESEGNLVENRTPALSFDIGAEIVIPDLDDGWYRIEVSALDTDASDDVILQGQSMPFTVSRRENVTVRLILAPVESFSTHPSRDSDIEDQLTARCDLQAVSFAPSEHREAILISGGALWHRTTSDAWLYRPETLGFERVGAMHCPRAGHSAAAITMSDGRQIVVVAGGGDLPCEGLGSTQTAANTLEYFDPIDQRFHHLDAMGLEDALLARAVVANLGVGTAFLASEENAWVLDIVGQYARAYEDPRLLDGEHQAVTVDDECVALLSRSGGGSRLQYFTMNTLDPGVDGRETRHLPVETDGAAMARLPWGEVFVSNADRWWSVRTLGGCRMDQAHTEGPLSESRRYHRAVPLAGQRVLLLGGVEEEVHSTFFIPEETRGVRTSISRTGPISRHLGEGLAVAPMSNGTALVVGCGEGPEVFNPNRTWSERAVSFDAHSLPNNAPPLRIVHAIDTSEQGRFIREKAATYAPVMVSPDWSRGLVEIGVLGTDLGIWEDDLVCRHREAYFPEWITNGSTPDLFDPTVHGGSLVVDRIRALDFYPDIRCPTQQPLLLSTSLGGGWDATPSSYSKISAHLGPVLLVLGMGTDDRSQDQRCRPEDDPTTGCRTGEPWLLDTEWLAERLLEGRSDVGPFEVVAVWDDGNRETCPTPLAIQHFVGALGDRGTLISGCTVDGDTLGYELLVYVKYLLYRSVCLPAGLENMTCQVTVSYRDDEVQLVDILEEGRDWSIEEASVSCIDEDRFPDRIPDRLAIAQEFSVPHNTTFERFEYVCW